jgi:pimeloyl-ACP methyl ester carboxylesterase
MEESFVTVGGKRTKLLRGGHGEPLVYLHSAGGETLWMPFHEQLASHFEVFAPAHPGFDTSEGLSEIDSIEDLVFHYLDFFDAMGWQSVNVMGMSLGGWIAAELATRHSARLRKMVLVDAAGLHVPGAPIAPLWEHMRDPERLRRLLFADPNGMLAQMMIMSLDDMPEQMMLMLWKASEATAKIGWNPYLHNPKLKSRLHRVRVPTLVIWGDRDALIPLAHGRAYAEGIPGAKLAVIENCGHYPIFERTDELVKHAAAFLK